VLQVYPEQQSESLTAAGAGRGSAGRTDAAVPVCRRPGSNPSSTRSSELGEREHEIAWL